jgi:hypothetical protein
MHKSILAGIGLAASLLAGGMAVPVARAESAKPPPGAEEFMTGAVALAPEEYARLPKLPTFRQFVPRRVDLSDKFPVPGHQGRLPSCTAWATTYAAQSFIRGRDIGHRPLGPSEQMSPAYVFRQLQPASAPCSQPIRVTDALDFLKTKGTVALADFPYDPAQCAFTSPASLDARAERFRLSDWRSVKRLRDPRTGLNALSLDDIKGALDQGQPIVFIMPALEDFKYLQGDTVYHHPEPSLDNLHAMALTGYDEGRQAFRLINSWGERWADHGYAWVDYETFRFLAVEAYALIDDPARRAPPPPPPPAPARPTREMLQAQADGLTCGSATVSASGGHLALRGFAGNAAQLAALRQAALAADPAVDFAVAHHPWPQCEAELTLAAPLAAGNVGLIAQTTDGRARGGDPVAMRAGEMFGISADVPAGKPFLSLVYLQADGSAVELWRGKASPAAAGGHSVTIGLGGETEARFRVAAPLGDEMVIALASDRPLFGDELKDYATERQFLTALRARLTTVAPDSVSAAVLRLRTSP